ncbi:hypothetical protein QQF64_013982 [Cirrhinus molitorella]|uniref:Uncharacterized protein n=1 Tax=Cirrhinus molitorella TaxID=172907 RepID=A0ABR3LSP7_9TELE
MREESCRGQLACCVCAGCREISVLLFTDGVVRQALLALLLSCVPWPLPLCQPTRLVPTSPTPPLHLPTLDFSFCLFLFLNLQVIVLGSSGGSSCKQARVPGQGHLSRTDTGLFRTPICTGATVPPGRRHGQSVHSLAECQTQCRPSVAGTEALSAEQSLAPSSPPYGSKAFDPSLSIKDSLSRVYLVIKKPLSDGSQSVERQSLPGAMPQFLVLKPISKLWPVPQSFAHTQKSAQGGSALTLGHTPPSPASPACQM